MIDRLAKPLQNALVACGLALVVSSAPACKKDACAAHSIGTCVEGSTDCGVQMTCADQVARELKCKGPDSHLPMRCECVEDGKTTRTVDVETRLPVDKALRQATLLATTKCGWKSSE